jgi:uncharacterized protein YdhG (YjbR/CyaY superfamily)
MPKDPSRQAHFPAIEKRYGEKMSYWFKVMKEIKDEKYPQQISYLRENYGFSQAHANALVMYSRGSITAKRFETPSDYYKSIDPKQVSTIKKIFKVIQTKYPKTELVIAWNQPMLRIDGKYVFGLSASKNHLTLNPFSSDVLDSMESKLSGYTVNKKTFIVPIDWKVDAVLLRAMVKARLAE